MGVYTRTEGSWLSRRGSFVILLVLFHALLVWGFKSGFAVKLIKSVTDPIKVEIINEVKPEEPPPPPPPVKAVELPPVSVPPLLVNIQVPVEAPPIQVTTAPPPPGPPAPPAFGPPAPPAPPAPVAAPTAFGVAYQPDTGDYYPPTSISMEEEGKVQVHSCWDVKGKVVESSVAKSSGKKRLDDAGLKMSKAFRYKPGTLEGQAVAGCRDFVISFVLENVR